MLSPGGCCCGGGGAAAAADFLSFNRLNRGDDARIDRDVR